MASRYGDFWAMRAAGFTKVAHQRKPRVKWAIILLLALLWAGFGLFGWIEKRAPSDALYSTLGALAMTGGYEGAGGDGNWKLEIARFSGLLLTAVGLLFGFSGAVGRSFARLWMMGASRHVVIAGENPAALALARSCREKPGKEDAVVVIARGLEPETAWSLRQSGVILIEGDPTHADTLKSARAGHASHVVALSDDDTENLRIEAALRALQKKGRRRLAAHVAIGAPLLLMEAREMRMLAEREAPAQKKRSKGVIDPRPFSLDEVAARALIARHSPEILDLAASQKRERLHIVVFGFDATAEAVVLRTLMSLWSASFGAPRVTVIAPDAADARLHFLARYPQADAYDVWRADIQFTPFDWTRRSLDGAFLDEIEQARGPASAVVVSTGSDGQNIQLALGIMRTANMRGVWAAPIFMKETTQSEFSRQFASGDRTPDVLDAYLQAFGAVEAVATRALIIEGVLDRGAGVAHRLYEEQMMHRDVDMRELEAVKKTWDEVPETYRNANRAVADSALVKLWDAGWKPTEEKGGEVHPSIAPDMLEKLSYVEHGRWVAERLLSGWRPGKRDNKLMLHDNIAPWEALSDELKARDADQVRAAAKVARALNPKGFVRR